MDTRPVRLVVLDADGVRAERLCEDLARFGHTVHAPGPGDAAFAALEEVPPELVLLVLDGEARGETLLARLRTGAALRAVPVVVLVPAGSAASLARALDLGADDFVQVPVDPALLNARIALCLERRALAASADSHQEKLHRLSHDLQDVILPLGVSLSAEKNVERLLERILLEAKALCHADAATLYERTRDDRLKFSIMLTDSLGVASGGTTGKEIPFAPLRLVDPVTGAPNHHNIATHAALEKRSVNIRDIYCAEAFDFTATREFDKRHNYRSVSTLTVPLVDHEDRVLAVLQLLNALDPGTGTVVPFDSYMQLIVESLASQAAVVFNNQVLMKRQEELLKFERDLQIGRQIQAGFLPESLPAPEGWQLAARFLPAREVAGDFYDAFMLGPDTMGFVVADVCDKGVGAALFMALVRSLVRVYIQQRFSALSAEAAAGAKGPEPVADATDLAATALRQAVILSNDYIGENHVNMNMFATMFAGVLNLENGSLVYLNAGHNAPIVARAGATVERLPSKSPAVGMVPGFQFPVCRISLNPLDLLVVFTDGIPDARDPHGRFFTEARLLQTIERMRTAPSEQLATEIQETLVAHISTAAQFDDITLMAIRRD